MSAENPDDNHPENEENAALDEEVDNLLESWGVTSDERRKRKTAAPFDPRKVYPGFIYTDSIKFQHLSNLTTCMRHFNAIRDDASLAAVLATLLEAQNPDSLKPQFRSRHQQAQNLICEIIMTGYHMLRRQPGASTYEQLQRLLRRARPFQLSEEGKSAVGILLAQLMKEEGHNADAYDALLSLSPPQGSREDFQRRYLLAKIRHEQWTQAMQAAAAPKTRGGPSQASTRNLAETQQQQHWNSFKNSTDVWGRAGRNARDLSQEAQGHFESAIALRPEASTDAVISLVEMAVSQGKVQEALQIAREHCIRAPLDSDAHAMTLGLLVSSRKASKKLPVSIEEIMHRCMAVLQTNCGDGDRAVQVLIKLGKKLPEDTLPPLTLIEGLCAYLDTTPPLLKLSGLPLKAWHVLSDCLVSLSEIVTNAYKTAKEAQDHLRQIQQNGKSAADHNTAVDTAAEIMKATQLDFQEAFHTYKAVQRLLEQRSWWQDCHLQLPKTTSKLMRLVNEGTASIDTLISLSIVHSVQLHAIESAKGRRVKLNLADPSSTFLSDRLATVVKFMKEIGTAEDVQSNFLAASKTVRLAATVGLTVEEITVQSTALAAAFAKIAADRVGLEQEMQMNADGTPSAASVPAQVGWKPCPLGATHLEIGFLSQLPDAWWKVFPQKRREERKKQRVADVGDVEEEKGEDDDDLNNEEVVATQQTQTQRRVRFNLPNTQTDSAMDTD